MNASTNRRGLFAGAAFLLAAGAQSVDAKTKSSQKPVVEDHSAHMHHDGGPDFALTPQEEAAVKALATCTSAGEACLSQCLQTLAAGDASMAVCASAVREMLAICRASQTLVEAHSSFAAQQLSLCKAACKACKGECAPHTEHHATCRTCAEACDSAIAAIDALLNS